MRRGRPARVSRLHPAADLAWARRARGAALRAPRADRGVASEQSVRPHRPAPAGPRRTPRTPPGQSGADPGRPVRLARPADAGELLTLQRCCWVSEAQANDSRASRRWRDPRRRPAVAWTLADGVVRVGGRLVGSVRGRLTSSRRCGSRPADGRPGPEGRGIGRLAADARRAARPPEATTSRLFTGARASATCGCTGGRATAGRYRARLPDARSSTARVEPGGDRPGDFG